MSINNTSRLMQALVGDTPPSVYLDGTVNPLSLTGDGRLRVASEASRSMIDFWGDPFEQCLTEVPFYGPSSLSFYP